VSHFTLSALSADRSDETAAFLPSTPKELWAQIKQDIYNKFSYCLRIWPGRGAKTSVAVAAAEEESASSKSPGSGKSSAVDDASTPSGFFVRNADRLALLRRVCQLLGVSVASRSYEFDVQPTSGADGVGEAAGPILPEDILGVAPVIKHGFPKCHMREVIEAVEFARVQLSQRRLAEAHAALQEALVFLYQSVGVMHEYVAVCCTLMAKVYNTSAAGADDRNTEDSLRMAILYERRALCVYERLKGFDAYQVMQSHNFLANLLTRAQDHHVAAKHMIRYIYLQRLALGSFPAEENSALVKLGSIYQNVGRLDQAVRVYDFALRKCMEQGDAESLEAANCRHLLARCFHMSGQYKNAIVQEQVAYKIFKAKLGPQHKHTLQCAGWMKRIADVANKEQEIAVERKKEAQKMKMRAKIEQTVRDHQQKQLQNDDYAGEISGAPKKAGKKKKKAAKKKKSKKR